MQNQSSINFLAPQTHNAVTVPNTLETNNMQILLDEVDRAWAASTKRIEGRVEEVLLQCERFEWIADELRDDVSQSHSISAAFVLANADSRTSDVERALVSLALKATIDSGILLHAYQPPKFPERLGLLHQIVKIEWENRYFSDADVAENNRTNPLFSA